VLRGTAPPADPAVQVRATQRRGVGRGDADEVARVRERGVSEGDRRPVRVQIDDVEDVLVQQGVDVAVDGLPVEVVGGEVFGGQLDGVRVHVGAGGVVPLGGGADAPNPRGRHRVVEVRRRARLAVAVRAKHRDSHVAVQLLGLKKTPPPVPSLAPSRASGTETVRPPSSMSIPRVRLSTTKDPLRVSCGIDHATGAAAKREL